MLYQATAGLVTSRARIRARLVKDVCGGESVLFAPEGRDAPPCIARDGSRVAVDFERAELPGGAAHEGSVFVGIRPEDLSLAEPGADRLVAKVELVEALGAETLIYLNTPRGAQIVLRQAARTRLQPGDSVGVAVDQSHLHWFDANGRLMAA